MQPQSEPHLCLHLQMFLPKLHQSQRARRCTGMGISMVLQPSHSRASVRLPHLHNQPRTPLTAQRSRMVDLPRMPMHQLCPCLGLPLLRLSQPTRPLYLQGTHLDRMDSLPISSLPRRSLYRLVVTPRPRLYRLPRREVSSNETTVDGTTPQLTQTPHDGPLQT